MKIAARILLISCVVLIFFVSMSARADSYSRLLKRGNRYFRNELFGEALKNYLEGKAKNPKALEPAFNAGDAYYKKEDYTTSIESFNESLTLTEKESKRADIYYNLGNSYLQSGDYEKAIDSYIKGLELFPADLNMKYNLELALKRLQEQKKRKEDKQSGGSREGASEKGVRTSEQQSKQGSGEPKEDLRAEEGARKNGNEQNEFSREEAERLIRSVNKEQIEIIKDMIKKRTGGEKTDKDW
jgi:Ca-activated chloride channel family protein